VPPLRERRDDIAPLVEHFISLFSNSERKDVRGVDEATMMLLRNYDWPGNVRQLENMVYRAVVLADGNQLTIEDFPQLAQTMGLGSMIEERAETVAEKEDAGAPSVAPTGSDLVSARDGSGQFRSLEAIEAEVIRRALDHYGGQMSEVARRLGIGRSTLYRKVREHGIEIEARNPTSAAGP
jgi:DNA-binding NtrC family response regulator